MERREGFGFYHVCTNGTVLPWMFKCEEDFIGGVNRIAVCKVISGVEVWTFTLMDNHVHFLLYGTFEMCKLFIVRYNNFSPKQNVDYLLPQILSGNSRLKL